MLTLKVFSIYDSKADSFLQPFFVPNRAMALRSFASACQEERSDFNRYSGDYTLFEIGDWESEKGIWVEYEAKINLGLASQYIQFAAEQGQLREVK